MKYECLGCEEKCSTTSAIPLTGCFYEDGDYPRDAKIWVPAGLPEHLKESLRPKVEMLKTKTQTK